MFSVIIPTLNRVDSLLAALESVDRAAANHVVEVLVVDNGSTDRTAARVEAFKASNVAVRYLFEDVAGVCRAKNLGISHAKGDIFVFTDDDCRLDEEYFSVLTALHSKAHGPAVIGGRVELGDPNDAPITIKTTMTPARYGQDANEFPGGFVHGCNLTMHRRVIDRVGLWDERFGPAGLYRAAEDTEMIYRSYKLGVPIFYDPRLVVYHFHGRRTKDEIAKLNRNYHYGNGAFLGRHADKFLFKHFYWNTRNWLMEFFGGEVFDQELGLSHGDLVKPQILGLIHYFMSRK